jgi:predicted MFS family arabinose efflux permease
VSARLIYATRGLRAIGDGLMSTSLATLLLVREFSERSVGIVSTATLLGSASALLLITRFAPVFPPRRVLVMMSALMVATGLVFGLSGEMILLVGIALIGPLNPSTGDVSAFLPAEQTVIGSATTGATRTMALARMSLVATTGAAIGSFLAGPLRSVGRGVGFEATQGVALIPLVYAAIGLAVIPIYLHAVDSSQPLAVRSPTRLGPSKRTVRELAAVFAMDSAGGGFVVYSIVGLWLQRRFGFSLDRIGAVLGLMSLAAAASSLLAPRLSVRFGLVNTMVFTHLPANVLLFCAALAPNAPVAVGLLLARSLLSQLDVAPRVSLVMALVTPEERSAASAFTNLPRSLATASTPLLGAMMLERSTFGWPLVVGATLKIVYDVVLWVRFRGLPVDHRPSEPPP